MKIAQVDNYEVSAVYNLQSIPEEFESGMGTIYHDLTGHPKELMITIGWRYEGGDFLLPLDTSSDFGRIITVLAYRLRFTQTERTMIKYASRQSTIQAAAIAADLDNLLAASYVHLDRPDTIEGTHNLETASLIGSGRADEILSSPVYSAELLSELRKGYGLPQIPTEKELLVNGGRGYTTVGEFFADNQQ